MFSISGWPPQRLYCVDTEKDICQNAASNSITLTVIHKSSVAILYNRDRFQQNGAGDRWVARRRRKILGISESKVVLLEQIRPFRAAFLDLKSQNFPPAAGCLKKPQGLFLSGLFLFSDSGKSVGGSCKTRKKNLRPYHVGGSTWAAPEDAVRRRFVDAGIRSATVPPKAVPSLHRMKAFECEFERVGDVQ